MVKFEVVQFQGGKYAVRKQSGLFKKVYTYLHKYNNTWKEDLSFYFYYITYDKKEDAKRDLQNYLKFIWACPTKGDYGQVVD